MRGLKRFLKAAMVVVMTAFLVMAMAAVPAPAKAADYNPLATLGDGAATALGGAIALANKFRENKYFLDGVALAVASTLTELPANIAWGAIKTAAFLLPVDLKRGPCVTLPAIDLTPK